MSLLVLESDPDCVGDFVDGVRVLASFDFRAAGPWRGDFPEVRLSVQGRPTDYFFAGALHICSPRFQEVVAGADVEFLPVEVLGSAGFAAMNVLDHRDVIDLSLSDVEVDEDGWVDHIEHLELLDVPGLGLARAARCWEDLVVVGHDLATRLGELTGVDLKAPAEWRW